MSADGARVDNIRPSAMLGDPPRDQRGEEGVHPHALNAPALGRRRRGSSGQGHTVCVGIGLCRIGWASVAPHRFVAPTSHLARTQDRATPFKGRDRIIHTHRHPVDHATKSARARTIASDR
eukprot:1144800-Prymnesium_polylepis.1